MGESCTLAWEWGRCTGGQLKGERVVNVCEMVGEPMAGLVSGGISESRVLCEFFCCFSVHLHSVFGRPGETDSGTVPYLASL